MRFYVYVVSPVHTEPVLDPEDNKVRIKIGDRRFYYECLNTGRTTCLYGGILFQELITWAKKSQGILLHTDDPEMNSILKQEGVLYVLK